MNKYDATNRVIPGLEKERDTANARAEKAEAILDNNERSAFCEWCGEFVAKYIGPLSGPKDPVALAAMLDKLRTHQRMCKDNPLCAEISAMAARAKKAEAKCNFLAEELAKRIKYECYGDPQFWLEEAERQQAVRRENEV